jgi:aminopeptidase N
MSDDLELTRPPGWWTTETYAAHNEALRRAEERFQTERDRRYSEVAVEREKALEIKNEADKAALGLAREIQTYKDEKANELREQINSERGLYATKEDVANAVDKVEATIQPLSDYITSQQGRSDATTEQKGVSTQWLLAIFGALFVVGGMGLSIVLTLVVLIANGKL